MRENSYRRGYNARWAAVRAIVLRNEPLCRYCKEVGRIKQAEVVDHIRPHRGDAALFWDPSNWQPLCKHCHDSVKKREEEGAGRPGCGPDGVPLDPRHPWNAEASSASPGLQ